MAKRSGGGEVFRPLKPCGIRILKRIESLIDIVNDDKVWALLLWAMLAGILITVPFYTVSSGFDPDELEHMHTTWMLTRGKEMYVDFFQHHHPFLHYMLVPVINIFGGTVKSILVSRYIMLILAAAILAVTWLISVREFRSREIGVMSLIFTSTIFSFYTKLEIRPDIPQSLTGLLSVYFLFQYYDNKSRMNLVASAVLLAVSFLFLQKSMILVFALGAMLAFDCYKKRVDFGDLLIFGTVFVLCLLPYYSYLVISGSFERYFMMNWVLNFHIPQLFGRQMFLLEGVKYNVPTFILYAFGLIMLFKSGSHRRFLALSVSLPLLTLLTFKNIWHHYLILWIPLCGIIAAYALCAVFSSRWFRLIFLLGAIYVPMSDMHNRGFFNTDDTARTEKLAKIDYVLSVTDEGDRVYDGDIDFNVFRDDIDYFWYCMSRDICLDTYQKLTGYEYDIYDLIATKKPKVISSYKIPSMQDISISGFYVQSEEYPDLYIRIDE